jgi:hypothetical protein
MRSPSQGWKTFLRNHAPDVAAMDLFVVPIIGFKLLYGFVIVPIAPRSRLDQRHNQPDGGVDRTAAHRGFSLGRRPGLHDPGPRSDLWHRRHTPIASYGHSGQTDCRGVTLAEPLCRTADRIDPARVFGPHHGLGRGTSAPDSNFLCRLLQLRQNASFIEQGCADFFVRFNRSESFVHTRILRGLHHHYVRI